MSVIIPEWGIPQFKGSRLKTSSYYRLNNNDDVMLQMRRNVASHQDQSLHQPSHQLSHQDLSSHQLSHQDQPSGEIRGILKTKRTRGNFLRGPNLLENSLSARVRGQTFSAQKDTVRRHILGKQFNPDLAIPPPLTLREEFEIQKKENSVINAAVINREIHENILREKSYSSLPLLDSHNELLLGNDPTVGEKHDKADGDESAKDEASIELEETCQHPIAFILPGDTTGMPKAEWREYFKQIQQLRDAERKSMKLRLENLVKSYADDERSSFHSNVFHAEDALKKLKEKKKMISSSPTRTRSVRAVSLFDLEDSARLSFSAPVKENKTVRMDFKSSTAPSPFIHKIPEEMRMERARTFSWEPRKLETCDYRWDLRSRDLHPVSTGLRREGSSIEQIRVRVLEKPRVSKVWRNYIKPTDNHKTWMKQATCNL